MKNLINRLLNITPLDLLLGIVFLAAVSGLIAWFIYYAQPGSINVFYVPTFTPIP